MGIWNNLSNIENGQKVDMIPTNEVLTALREAEYQGRLNGYMSMARDSRDHDKLQISTAYGAIYTKVSQIRQEMFKDIDRIKKHYISDVILDQVTEDALTSDVSTGEIVNITSSVKEIQNEIDLLNEKYDFDRMVQAITPDMLAYGEYTLRTEVKTKPRTTSKNKRENKLDENQEDVKSQENTEYGLLDLHDDVLQHSVVALSKFGDITAYLSLDMKTGKITKYDPAEFVQFSVINRSIRVDLHEHFAGSFNNGMKINSDILSKIPRYVRVGKSLLYPIISKVKELELLEQLVPATKLSKLSDGTIIGVQVPAGYELEKALKLSQKLEGIINKRISVDMTKDEVSVANILNTAGKIKVVPLFGDKGQTQKMDVRSDEPDDLLSSVEDIRRVITASIGVPYEILFSDDNTNKAEVHKRYARYLRLLKNIQKSIVQGLSQIIMIHLANKDIPFKKSDIEINFRNKLIEIDSLDRLEFLDSSIQMIENIKTFVNDLAEPESAYKDAIDLNVFLKFIDKQLSMVGLAGLVDPEKEIDVEDVESDDGDQDQER